MELNKSPVATSNHYGVNSINIDKNAIFSDNNCKNGLNYKNYDIINGENIIVNQDVSYEIDSFLNDDIKSELINNSNLKLNLKLTKDSDLPTIIDFKLTDNEQLNDIINLSIENSISSKVILKLTSTGSNICHKEILKINLDVDSKLDIIIVSDLGNKSNNFISIQSDLQKNAKLSINIVDFALNNSIWNYKSKILGENSVSKINSLYMGNDNSIIDLNYLIEIFKPNCHANIEVVGALNENARKHFKGTIDFKKGCKKSVGNENELCMLLSNTAKSKALPMLLCTEEDVDGKHSSSVGKVNEKELFYIMSRGLDFEEAKRLIIKARFNTVISELFDEELKHEILNKIDGKI